MKVTLWIMLLCCVLTGCVTPAAIKQASTQHATNLSLLAAATENYRAAVKSYYEDLVSAQRQAYVAQHLGASIDAIAKEQYETLARYAPAGTILTALPRKLPDQASIDFITSATKIREDQNFWNKNFQAWLDEYKGLTLSDKREWLKEQADTLARANDQDRVRLGQNLQREAERTEQDLTYVSAAIDLRRQAAELEQKLDRLARQVTVMQKFHAVIDEYLSIDATIDAKAIAQAAAAGAKVDLTELPELTRVLSPK